MRPIRQGGRDAWALCRASVPQDNPESYSVIAGRNTFAGLPPSCGAAAASAALPILGRRRRDTCHARVHTNSAG